MKIICSLLLILPVLAFSQLQIASVPFNPDLNYTSTHFNTLENISATNSGMSKVNAVFNSSPYVSYSTNDFWPAGSWGRGYETEMPINIFYDEPLSTYPQYRYACHPLARRTADFILGHLNLLELGHSSGNSLQKAKDGIDFLLTQQYPNGSSNAGAFAFWLARESTTNLNMNLSVNKASNYSTSYALQALCEYYLSGINHRRPEVLNAIQLGQTYLLNRDWTSVASQNNNVRGLGLWALCEAYKVTNNCTTYKKIKEIANKIMSEQNTGSTDIIGTWQTGSIDTVDVLYIIRHDTKIEYHFMIIRGLIEALNIIPSQDYGFKSDVSSAVKLGVNHIINCRLMNGSDLRYAWRTTDQSLIYPSPLYASGVDFDYQNFMEPIAKLYYYSKDSDFFNPSERINLRNLMNKIGLQMTTSKWRHFKAICQYSNYKDASDNARSVYDWTSSDLNYNSPKITGRIVQGDFDNDGFSDDIVGFYDYGNEEAKAHQWKSNGNSLIYNWIWSANGYDVNKITGRVVSGDFDNDGYIDDIAALYDYGNDLTKVHLWKSNGSNLSYSQPWSSSGYNANKITGRVVSGDFDNDGYIDDIAAFYDYGNEVTKIHLWKSNGTSFVYSWSWSITGYNSNKITDRLVSGDFDGDGYYDDIAAFYDYGPNQTKIHSWKSNGINFSYSWDWNSIGYDATKITGRVVSGDFDSDGIIDDIAAFYDYGNEEVKLHKWLSNNNTITYSWWWQANGYNVNKITGRVLSGDYNQNCYKNDINAFYDYGADLTNAHKWIQGNYHGPTSWWLPCPNSYVNNCTTRRDFEDHLNNEASIPNLDDNVKVYPNPFNTTFHIESDNLIDAEIKLVSLSGEVLNTITSNSTSVEFDAEHLAPGVYILQINSKKINQQIKIVHY